MIFFHQSPDISQIYLFKLHSLKIKMSPVLANRWCVSKFKKEKNEARALCQYSNSPRDRNFILFQKV